MSITKRYSRWYAYEILNKVKKDEQEKGKIIIDLNEELIEIDDELNRKVLCEDSKEKKIGKLITKCGNEEIAKLLYESKLNSADIEYIR